MENLLKSGVRRVKVWKDGREEVFSYSGEIRNLIKQLDQQQVDDVLIEELSMEELFLHYYETEGQR